MPLVFPVEIGSHHGIVSWRTMVWPHHGVVRPWWTMVGPHHGSPWNNPMKSAPMVCSNFYRENHGNFFMGFPWDISVRALVWFSCSQEWKWMMHRTITAMSCCSNSCCHTSVKLLATFTFQCTMRAQEHRAAVTQDSGLRTRHAASQ